METHIQLEKSKPIRQHPHLQTDKCSTGNRLSTTVRLDGQGGHSSGIFPRPCLRWSQKVSAFTVRRPRTTITLGNDVPTIWPMLSAENIRIDNKLDSSISPRSRWHPNYCVSRRFFAGTSRQEYPHKTSNANAQHTCPLRLAIESREICLHPSKGSRIPGYCLEHMAERETHPSEVGFENTVHYIQNVDIANNDYQRVTKSHRCTELRELRRTKGSPTLQVPAKSSQQGLATENDQNIFDRSRSPRRIKMVAIDLPEEYSDSRSATIPLSDNRCQRHRLGCQTRRHVDNRFMAPFTAEPSLQSQGDAGYIKCLTRSLSAPELTSPINTVRQQDCCLISKKRGGGKIYSPHRTDNEGASNLRPIQYSHVNLSHSRELQLRCRPFIASKRPSRMASPTTSNRNCICQMGNPGNRSFCFQTSSCGSSILHTRPQRQPGEHVRCPRQRVELQVGMAIPAALSNSQSVITPEQCSGPVLNRSPEMAPSLLETGSEEPCTVPSIYHTEPVAGPSRYNNRTTTSQDIGDDDGGMAMWGWMEHLNNWSEEQKALLLSSWRESTLKTYRPAWNRWLNWAKTCKVNVYNPTGSDLARFLSDLHQKEGLSYSTILVHKSVVSTFCNPNEVNKLSTHTLVKQVLKSIGLAKPKNNKAPIWDINTLVKHISDKSYDSPSLFITSQRTAAILLLCSGRRLHDLTLLSVTQESCIISDDNIILWPSFGSKTDSTTHQQSGWKLSKNKDNKSLDPIYWIRLLIELGKPRRIAAKCNNLFMSTTGDPKAATRTIIGGWVKKLLQEANINATPGSFRSAVASKNWTEHFSLDDILSRGNWKSAKTFQKFYQREIKTADRRESLITNLFTPIE